jgi:hypothetical protein
MHLHQPRVRILMFVVWLSAFLLAGAVDVLEEQRVRDRVSIIHSLHADGPCSTTLVCGRRTDCYLGPVPIGPCPVAVFSELAVVGSVAVWALCLRRKRGPPRSRCPARAN